MACTPTCSRSMPQIHIKDEMLIPYYHERKFDKTNNLTKCSLQTLFSTKLMKTCLILGHCFFTSNSRRTWSCKYKIEYLKLGHWTYTKINCSYDILQKKTIVTKCTRQQPLVFLIFFIALYNFNIINASIVRVLFILDF